MSWQRQRDMTGLQFRLIIKKLGMSRAGAGRFLGVSEATTARWAKDKIKTPTAVSLLLRMMAETDTKPIVPEWERE